MVGSFELFWSMNGRFSHVFFHYFGRIFAVFCCIWPLFLLYFAVFGLVFAVFAVLFEQKCAGRPVYVYKSKVSKMFLSSMLRSSTSISFSSSSFPTYCRDSSSSSLLSPSELAETANCGVGSSMVGGGILSPGSPSGCTKWSPEPSVVSKQPVLSNNRCQKLSYFLSKKLW